MSTTPTPYSMCINNVAAYIRSDDNRAHLEQHGRMVEVQALTAFEASAVLAIAFCKSKEEVIADLIATS